MMKTQKTIQAKRRYLIIPTYTVAFPSGETRKNNPKLLLREGRVEWVGCQRGVEAEAED